MRPVTLLSLLLFVVACQRAPTDTLGADEQSWQTALTADVEPCSNGDCPPPDDGCSNGDCPPSEGGGVKVEVCHRAKSGSFRLLSIAEPALEAHIAHGDGAPGGPVPGLAGYVFDEACEAVPACPCFDWTDLDWAYWRDSGGYFVFITRDEASGPAAYLEVWDADDDIVAWAYAYYRSGPAYCDFADITAPPTRFEADIGDAAAQACQTLIHDKAIELGCPAAGGTC